MPTVETNEEKDEKEESTTYKTVKLSYNSETDISGIENPCVPQI